MQIPRRSRYSQKSPNTDQDLHTVDWAYERMVNFALFFSELSQSTFFYSLKQAFSELQEKLKILQNPVDSSTVPGQTHAHDYDGLLIKMAGRARGA